jgi:adenylate kinase family enzyme
VASRLINRTFKTVHGHGPIEAPELYDLVKRLVGEAWETDPTEALRTAIDQAAKDLSDMGPVRKGASLTWEKSAVGLFNLEQLDLDHVDGKKYDYLVEQTFASDNSLNYGDDLKKDIARNMRLLIAKQLLKRDPETVGQQTQASAEEAAESTFQIEQILIDRDEYLSRLRSHLDTGYQIICIWGEPGTGKTTLAKQLAAQLDGIGPVLTIRMTPTPEAPTVESLLFRQDLTDALIAEGLNPADWNLESRLSEFRDKLAEDPRAKAVILDNVEREELVGQLIPAQPKIPVIITMRVNPQDNIIARTIAREELDDFTESQASEFINRHLSGQNEQEVVFLARALGYRPLALEHAVLFVKESPGDYNVRDLTHDLRLNVTDTLATVTPPEQQERNISRLYEIILASLLEDESAQAVLDAFLAVAGQSGITLRELVYIFMQSDQGGSHDRLHFLAGLRTLARRGLLREKDAMRQDPYQHDGDSPAPVAELSMHALTYRILRDLSGMKPFQIEARYLDFIRTSKRPTPEDGISFDARTQAWALNGFITLAQDGLPDGWLSYFLIDPHTSVVTREPEADTDSREPYTVRYTIEEDGLYKLDYRTGRWSELDIEEMIDFRLATLVYNERGKSYFIPLMPEVPSADESNVPQIQFDREVSPAGDYQHVSISQVPDKYLMTYGVSVRSLCGKISVPMADRSTASCPDCLRIGNSPEWLRGIEIALLDAFRYLSAKHPLYSAELCLTRAWLRRALKRHEESIPDLTYAFDFLSKATEASRYERLFVGLEIAMMANRGVPDELQGWILVVHEHLKTLMADAEPSEPAMLFLRHIRSQSLQQVGLEANALIDLNEIVALVDSGAADRKDMDVDLWKILWEKQEIERRLGRFDERDASLQRFITEAEARDDGGRLLTAGLLMSGICLSVKNPEQARSDLLRAIGIHEALVPKNYEGLCRCLINLAFVANGQGDGGSALQAAERALRLVDEHLPDHAELRDEAQRAINQVKGTLPDGTN